MKKNVMTFLVAVVTGICVMTSCSKNQSAKDIHLQ
jgi:hypothetical protein